MSYPLSLCVFISLLCAVLSTAGCSIVSSDPTDEDAFAVAGIEVRDRGNNFLGAVGSPAGSRYDGENLQGLGLYPNPVVAGSPLTVNFVLGEDAQLRIRLEQAPPTDAFHSTVTQRLPGYPRAHRSVAISSVVNSGFAAGSYSTVVHTVGSEDVPLSAGYYQAILETEDGTARLDLLIVEDETDIQYLLGMERATSQPPSLTDEARLGHGLKR